MMVNVARYGFLAAIAFALASTGASGAVVELLCSGEAASNRGIVGLPLMPIKDWPDTRYVLDLAGLRWCTGDCAEWKEIFAVTPKIVIITSLTANKRDLKIGIDRKTRAWFEDVELGDYRAKISGRCRVTDNTGNELPEF
jgi:hypothetical protein